MYYLDINFINVKMYRLKLHMKTFLILDIIFQEYMKEIFDYEMYFFLM